jgi:hypothetical protein
MEPASGEGRFPNRIFGNALWYEQIPNNGLNMDQLAARLAMCHQIERPDATV